MSKLENTISRKAGGIFIPILRKRGKDNGFWRSDQRSKSRNESMSQRMERKDFNSRLREGGDCPLLLMMHTSNVFQFTPPRGRRQESTQNSVSALTISIHASAREATRPRSATSEAQKFQFTPPRGRRQSTRRENRRAEIISIHASAREATQSSANISACDANHPICTPLVPTKAIAAFPIAL